MHTFLIGHGGHLKTFLLYCEVYEFLITNVARHQLNPQVMCVCIFADDRLLWGNHRQTHGHTCATLWLIWVALNSQARAALSQLLLFFEVSRLWALLCLV